MTEINPQKIFCSTEMLSRLNNAARGLNLFSKMALEEKSVANPWFRPLILWQTITVVHISEVTRQTGGRSNEMWRLISLRHLVTYFEKKENRFRNISPNVTSHLNGLLSVVWHYLLIFIRNPPKFLLEEVRRETKRNVTKLNNKHFEKSLKLI